MANDKETLEEISTWIRVDFHEICPWQAHGGRCAGCPLGGNGKNCIFDKIADKVDAAAKRERTEIEADALAVGGIVEAVARRDAAIHAMTVEANERLREHLEIAIENDKRTAVGNAAAMREAVVLALSLLDLKEGVPYKTISQKDIDFMKAALSAPRRNCDMFGGDYKMLHTAWFDWTGSPSEQNPDGTAKLTFAEWLLEIAEVHHA